MKKQRDYKISHEKPVVAEECERVFSVNWDRGFALVYGDTIFFKKGLHMTQDHLVHECVHILQQRNYPGGPAEWWKRYFTDSDFRLSQEIEAYRRQWISFCQLHKSMEVQQKFFKFLMKSLNKNYGFKSLNELELNVMITSK